MRVRAYWADGTPAGIWRGRDAGYQVSRGRAEWRRLADVAPDSPDAAQAPDERVLVFLAPAAEVAVADALGAAAVLRGLTVTQRRNRMRDDIAVVHDPRRLPGDIRGFVQAGVPVDDGERWREAAELARPAAEARRDGLRGPLLGQAAYVAAETPMTHPLIHLSRLRGVVAPDLVHALPPAPPDVESRLYALGAALLSAWCRWAAPDPLVVAAMADRALTRQHDRIARAEAAEESACGGRDHRATRRWQRVRAELAQVRLDLRRYIQQAGRTAAPAPMTWPSGEPTSRQDWIAWRVARLLRAWDRREAGREAAWTANPHTPGAERRHRAAAARRRALAEARYQDRAEREWARRHGGPVMPTGPATRATAGEIETARRRAEELGTMREAAVRRLAEARALGDLGENAEYQAAREELAAIDAERRRLEAVLHARVVEEVRVRAEVDGERMEIIVGGAGGTEERGAVRVSRESPVGRAVLEALAARHQEATAQAPGGPVRIRLLSPAEPGRAA